MLAAVICQQMWFPYNQNHQPPTHLHICTSARRAESSSSDASSLSSVSDGAARLSDPRPAPNTHSYNGTDLAENRLPVCCLRSLKARTQRTTVPCSSPVRDRRRGRRAAALGARLLPPGATMAEPEDRVTIPEFSCLLQMDPSLETYEKDFKRR